YWHGTPDHRVVPASRASPSSPLSTDIDSRVYATTPPSTTDRHTRLSLHREFDHDFPSSVHATTDVLGSVASQRVVTKLCEFTLCKQNRRIEARSVSHRASFREYILHSTKQPRNVQVSGILEVEPSPVLARSQIVVNVERKTRPLLKRAPTPDYRPRRDWVFVRNKWPLMVFLVGVSADNARSVARLALNPRKQRAVSQTPSRHCLANDPTF
ncbi:unnamed protein product, partial [Heterotrigona itama]